MAGMIARADAAIEARIDAAGNAAFAGEEGLLGLAFFEA
jgi:hypothetical protein